jgi:hypothetical protein
MASLGTLNLIVKFNTKDLSTPLKMIAIPAKMYLFVVNLYRKATKKQTTTLKITIKETEANNEN